ncbi:MAG: GNAT family N-acetyltransferase [Cyclobacteriaceae bacterium]
MKCLIHTKRLKLIPFDLEDSKIFLELNNNPFIRKYLWDDEMISQETCDDIIRQNQAYFNKSGYGLWKINEIDGKHIVGYVGLWYFFEEPQPQLIYALLPAFTKKGYAKEAGLAIVEFAFNHLGFSYLTAATDEPHKASQNVALSIGMEFLEKRIENEKPTLFYRINKDVNLK